jgi:mono/diheme cytochrome c family protein
MRQSLFCCSNTHAPRPQGQARVPVLQKPVTGKLNHYSVPFFLDTMPFQTVKNDGRIIRRIRRRLFQRHESARQCRKETMLRSKTFLAAVAGILCLASFYSGRPARLLAQDKPAATPSGSAKLSEQKLSEQETRGEGIFFQRCSLCHLPRKLKFGSPAAAGPVLSGQFKDAGPDQLKVLRAYILKGGPGMPGFQYGLEPKEVDDLIAFLKTL